MARPKKITVGDSNNIVTKFQDRMKVYRDFRESNFDRKWEQNYTMYKSMYMEDQHTSPTRSKLFVPMSYWTVENWMTKVAAAFFAGDRIWEVIPRFKKSSGLIKSTQYLLDYQTDIYDWEALLMDILKSTGIYGLSWTFFGWDLKVSNRETEIQEPVMDKKGVPKRDPVSGEIIIKTRTVKEPFIDQDRPLAMLVHPKEVYWDPKGTTVDNCTCIFREYWQDIEQIEKKKTEGTYDREFNLSDLANMSSKEEAKDPRREKTRFNPMFSGTHVSSVNDAKRKRILTWDIYEDSRMYTILNEKIWVREKVNPLPRKIKPIMLVRSNPMPHELTSMSEIDQVASINIERNTIRNQRIDQVSLDINKMFLVDKNAGVDKKQLYSAPNHYIEVHPIAGSVANAIQVLQSPSVPMSSYSEESMLDNDAQQSSGQLDYAIGQTPARREAARTVKSLQTAAFQRFDITKVKPLMFQLKKFPQLVMLLNKTYLTDDAMDVRVFNKANNTYDWQQVKVEDIDVECDFRYPGSLGKSMKIERREELRVMLEQMMAYQGQYMSMGGRPIFNLSAGLRYWLKEAEWGDLADELIMADHPQEVPISPQTMQKDLAAQDQLKIAQMAQGPADQQAQADMASQGEAADGERVARIQRMSDEKAANDFKLQKEQDKHDLEMKHKQEMHDLEMKLMASKKDKSNG